MSDDLAGLDPRSLYREALAWVRRLLAAIETDQRHAATGCPGFDVSALAGHLVTTVERARVIGEGGDPAEVPLVIGGDDDTVWVDSCVDAERRMWPVWQGADALERPVRAPWGTVPGRAALWGYLNETLVHGFDLALAIGQDAEADPELAATALAMAPQVVPAEPRGGHVPFGPVLAARAGAGATERLAAWSGRGLAGGQRS